MEKEKYSWLHDNMDGLKEKILYKDRIEYRISGKLHNSAGPALISFSPEDSNEKNEEYYINGEKLPETEWLLYNRESKLTKIKKKLNK